MELIDSFSFKKKKYIYAYSKGYNIHSLLYIKIKNELYF